MKNSKNVLISGDFSITEVKVANVQTNGGNGAAALSILSMKAEERKEALRKAGVDVSNLFSMGDDMLVRVVDGTPSEVKPDDPIYLKITADGTIPERRLFRRWVMAQMFRMLREVDKGRYNLTQCIESNGYRYMFRMLRDEFRVQSRLAVTDPENFVKRNTFFNYNTLIAILNADINNIKKYINGLPIKHCKGKPYVKVGNRDIFTSDLNKKLYWKLQKMVNQINSSMNPHELYHVLVNYDNSRVKLHCNTKMPIAFINAYKGAGAYATMENLIRFHDCRFEKCNTVERSLSYLNAVSESYRNEGWRMVGVLKELIQYNNISIDKKIKSWEK